MILAAVTCAAMAAFHALDFWIGTWRVTSQGQYAGTDVVTRELNSCAVIERWTGAEGYKGISLFTYDPFANRWEQTWVTDRATRIGGLKHKTLIYRFPDGGTRFQGVLPAPASHKIILDRTTLRPMADGTVRQVIEISDDGGDHWRVAFDATYRREASSRVERAGRGLDARTIPRVVVQ